MGDFTFEIVEDFGILSENDKGYKRKLTKVKWNRREAKYDIRDWSPDNKKMSKGLTFTENELLELGKLIDEIFNVNKFEETKEKLPF